ncbi:hypothetical protein BC342_25550 [Streptomyces olivaceus]|nr:hypothetical protein BC342_25550 [Streptomyces olivaceus]
MAFLRPEGALCPGQGDHVSVRLAAGEGSVLQSQEVDRSGIDTQSLFQVSTVLAEFVVLLLERFVLAELPAEGLGVLSWAFTRAWKRSLRSRCWWVRCQRLTPASIASWETLRRPVERKGVPARSRSIAARIASRTGSASPGRVMVTGRSPPSRVR